MAEYSISMYSIRKLHSFTASNARDTLTLTRESEVNQEAHCWGPT